MDKELIKVTVSKDGYQIKEELWKYSEHEEPTRMKAAYTPSGEYIGDVKFARFLVKRGIIPQINKPDHNVCSIGYCPSEKKWYGWSHRAIAGFGIGDKIFEEDFGDDKTPFVKHGSVTIKTLEEAKRAAANFAEYVS